MDIDSLEAAKTLLVGVDVQNDRDRLDLAIAWALIAIAEELRKGGPGQRGSTWLEQILEAAKQQRGQK